MRRFLSLFMVFMLSGILAFAQGRVVTGKVTDDQGNPVPFATIKVKGSKTGVSADANGVFTIKASDADVLVISATGLKTSEVSVGSRSFVTASLEKGAATELKEVVVTGAFQTKRTARSTTSNVQVVSGEALDIARSTNINNAMAGKVAGAQVLSQSAVALGRETHVRLRGANSLTSGGTGNGSNQGKSDPIYVVNGTIVTSTNDINVDDIEDISVRQGPSATALFGPAGSNGAIVITTKSGKRNTSGIGVDVNSGVQFDKVYVVPQYQNSYMGGASGDFMQYHYQAGQPEGWKALDGKFYPDYTDDASWGPRIAGQEYIPWYAWYPGTKYSFKTAKLTPQPNNVRDFWGTGVTWNNNVSFGKAGDGYNFRMSYGNIDQKGLLPKEYLKRNSFSVNTSIDLNNHFTVGGDINYMAQDRNASNDDNYSNQSSGSFNQWFHRDLDINILKELRDLKSPEGILASWNHYNPTSYDPDKPGNFYRGVYWANHYAYYDDNSNVTRRDRVYGNVFINYKIIPSLSVKFTYRKDQLTTNNEEIFSSLLEKSVAQSQSGFEGNGLAGYGAFNTFTNRQWYEAIATYTKKFNADFNLDANAGMQITKFNYRDVSANTNGGLNVDNVYALTNGKNPLTYGNTRQQSTGRALFVTGVAGFRNMVFLEGTYRRDYSSTEPQGHSIPTSSVGASWVFSELTKNKTPWLSYGKIRASWGEILNTLGIYDLGVYYPLNAQTYPHNGNNLFLQSAQDRLLSDNYHGAKNTEKEIGIELRFLKNRLGTSITYWDRTNKDIPVDVPISQTSGYATKAINAGEISKKGIEVSLNATPVKLRNFDWSFNATWAYTITNKIVAIAPGIDRVNIAAGAFAGTYAAYVVNALGHEWGQLYGGAIQRVNGQPVVDANGLFVRNPDAQYLGSVLPQYTGGIQNTFNFLKRFNLGVNIDYSYGGKYFSLSDFWGTVSGLTAKTAGLNDRGMPQRDPVADGGGVHVTGVDADGKTVDRYVDAYDYYHQFYNNKIAEPHIKDLTFVKLREMALGVNIPVDKIHAGKWLRSANFSIVGRNLWLIYAKDRDFDPSEISNVQGEDAQYPGTRSLGFNLKLGF